MGNAASRIRERIGYALAPGGRMATLLWAVKVTTRVQFDIVYRATLAPPPSGTAADADARPSHRSRLRAVDGAAARAALSPALYERLETNTGRGLQRINDADGIVYFLAAGEDDVACQLNISRGPVVEVDTPALLRFDLAPGIAFLSYLYTHERHRRQGAAGELIRAVRADLARRGFSEIVAHVSATNVPSLTTFRRDGWKRAGTIATTTGGRLLGTPGLDRRRVGVRNLREGSAG